MNSEIERQQKTKLILAMILIALVIILFYFYISTDKDSDAKYNISQNANRLTKEKFLKDIDSIISTFGIKKEWTKDISTKEKEPKSNAASASLWISKEVLIPVDLPTIDLNFEISNYLRSNNFEGKVIEDPKTKNISMDIFSLQDSGKKQAGILKFVYSDTIKRNAAGICIILDSMDSYDLTDVEKILNSTQEFSVFLPLRNDKADYQSLIMDLKKNYLIKFSIGDENDVEADFKDDMKESVWKLKVKSVCVNFPQATGIIISDKKDLKDFNYDVTAEFEKNNFKIYKDSLFGQFKRSENKIASLFSDIISKSNSGKKILFYAVNLNPNEFSEYDREVYTMKKLGYKFLDFNEMMKRVIR
ncbi:MAG: hypothetical protein M3R36_07310 [Bacteroidota bacterium]|nr:hypothetical protein [Bacteroidota bacterium]